MDLRFSLTDPAYTVYESCALGGLAVAIASLQSGSTTMRKKAGMTDPSEILPGVRAGYDETDVSIEWDDNLGSAYDIMQKILAKVFEVDEAGIFRTTVLPSDFAFDLHRHQVMTGTFYQHQSSRVDHKNKDDISITIPVTVDGDKHNRTISYKRFKKKVIHTTLDYGTEKNIVVQSLIPGVIAANSNRNVSLNAERMFLIRFLLVGTALYKITYRNNGKYVNKFALIMPCVHDLIEFVPTVLRMDSVFKQLDSESMFTTGSEGEAALAYNLSSTIAAGDENVGFEWSKVIIMGKLSIGNGNQKYRLNVYDVDHCIPYDYVYRKINDGAPSKLTFSKENDTVSMLPKSFVQQNVADNIVKRKFVLNGLFDGSLNSISETLRFQNKKLLQLRNAIMDQAPQGYEEVLTAGQKMWVNVVEDLMRAHYRRLLKAHGISSPAENEKFWEHYQDCVEKMILQLRKCKFHVQFLRWLNKEMRWISSSALFRKNRDMIIRELYNAKHVHQMVCLTQMAIATASIGKRATKQTSDATESLVSQN